MITRSKYVEVVKSYAGAQAGSTKHKTVIDYFNKVRPDGWAMTYTAPWCAAFASACAIQAFGAAEAQKSFPLSANCGVIVNKAIKMGIWIESDAFIPRAGDWIIYDWEDSGYGDDTTGADHVGVVISVANGIIKVIEGNWANKVSEREIKINARCIRGFVAPRYEAEAAASKTVPKVGEVWQITRDKGLWLYATPSKKGEKIQRLKQGVSFTVHDTKTGKTSCFAKVKKSGQYGWVLVYDKNGTYCKKIANPKPSGKIRVSFDANGGTGDMAPQDFAPGKAAKLKANAFTRAGYTFAGWADKDGKPVMTGSDVTKFKNVDMLHFQLGKVKFKDKASVEPTEDTTLYAVWKGSGARAAVEWAKLIAADNSFHYGTSPEANRWGCYFCDSNKLTKPVKTRGDKWDKTYCCNTFIHAAFAHGCNNKAMINACDQRHSRKWGIAYSPNTYGVKGTKYEGLWNTSTHEWVQLKKDTELKTGDVLTSLNPNGSGHTWMYIGGGKIVEASGGGWSDKSISIKNKTNQSKADYVFRYQKKK